MLLKALCKGYPLGKLFTTKTLLVMKITAIILLSACLTASANGYSQKVTLSEKNARLEKVFKEIKKQTGYVFFYDASILDGTKPVTIDVRNASVEQVLQESLKNQLLDFSIQNKTITIIRKDIQSSTEELPLPPPPITVKGRVVNENGEGVVASVLVKGTQNGTTTNANGYFELTNVDENATLVITGVSIDAVEVKVNGRTEININTKTKIVEGDDVRISTGYWTTTKKNATGSIVKIGSKEIEKQPVTSPLMALQGRVAGLDITPTSGIAGSAGKVEIRGRNSVRFDGGLPLYVIDGIPVDSRSTNNNYQGISNLAGFDPISSINPANIESIEVLKDADATAIYGSRGANGVILITTKRGAGGKTNVEISSSAGFGKVTRFLELLNTRQYLDMRYESFRNGGATPQPWDAPDLLDWDTTRYTNWQKELLGKSTSIYDVQLNVSGGTQQTSFRFGVGYHKEGMIFPGDFGYKRTTGHFNLTHRSIDNRFRTALTVNYGVESNDLFSGQDPVGSALLLAPVAPKLYNEDGSLNWANSTWNNPLAPLRETVSTTGNNIFASNKVSYELLPGLTIQSNFGYTQLNRVGIQKIPLSSFDPAWIVPSSTATANFENTQRNSWIIEPQISYSKEISGNNLELLVGGTLQEARSQNQVVNGQGYTSDALLGSLRGASSYRVTTDASNEYRYTAIYGRAGYNIKDRYLINLTGRRDGSSRFGQNNRFANFGAIGAGWIFSKEDFLKNQNILSFGKLRGSYGTTGNDQIADYRFLSTYMYSSYAYQGATGLLPTGLNNPDLQWEITRKLEFALELGFLRDRISFTGAWYRNRSSNQLLNYPLPSITGFAQVVTNLDALVENTGLELSLQTINIEKKNFRWVSSFNITLPRNKLVSFPGIETSSYKNLFVVGQTLNGTRTYTSLGVNPQTGLYEVMDVNNDGKFDDADYNRFSDRGRSYFGGFNNSIQYKGFEISFLIQFSKQMRQVGVPLGGGWYENQPLEVYNNRWQKPGDVAQYQKFTTGFDIYDPLNNQINTWPVADASFLRLKTLSLAYQLPEKIISKMKIEGMNFFVQGQNLFTLTKMKLQLDPETGNGLPPLTMLSGGITIRL